MDNLEDRIRRFVIETFLFGKGGESFRNDDSFLETGIVDSTGVLELVGFLERELGVIVEDDELTPTNLDSIEKLVTYVKRKLHGKSAPIAG
jgi:acyl carrier protein